MSKKPSGPKLTPNPALRDRDFKRILLIKPSSLGDVIHALPVLADLRRIYPDAHIAWLVARSFAPVIAQHPAVDEIIEFDRRHFGRLGRSLAATRDFIGFVAQLRRRRFDLVVDLQGLFRSGFFTLATGAPVRVGFRSARELAWVGYTHRVETPDPNEHAVDRNRRCITQLGHDSAAASFDLALTGEEKARASTLLHEAQLGGETPFVVVLPGARWETKQWHPDRFAELVAGLHRASGIRSVLLGGGDEFDICQQIADAAGSDAAVSLAGRTDLRGLVAVLDRAAAVVCHDSGPMHIATALQRPMVCIVGPTNPSRTGPYQQDEAVIRLDLECSPCYLRRLSQSPVSHRCMTDLTVQAVLMRLTSLLNQSSAVADI